MPKKYIALAIKLVRIGLVIIALLSLAAYVGEWHKLFDLAAQLRLQLLIGAALGLIITLIQRWWLWSVVAVLGLALNCWPVAVWYLPKSDKVIGNNRRIKLVQSNVYYKSDDFQDLMDFLDEEKPDIVALQEINSKWADGLKPLNEKFQDVLIREAHWGQGIAVYSNIKFDKTEVLDLGNDHRPTMLVQFTWEGRTISLLTAHSPNPFGRNQFEWRNEHLSAMAKVLNELPAPKLVAGDLNITMWSPYYQRFMEQTQLVNAREGQGLVPTWHAKFMLPFLMIPIDHCLVSKDIDVVSIRAGRRVGSDHLPLVVELAIPNE